MTTFEAMVDELLRKAFVDPADPECASLIRTAKAYIKAHPPQEQGKAVLEVANMLREKVGLPPMRVAL